jgi:hypothetical protein
MKLVEVTNKKTQKDFIQLPKDLYKNHPEWVSPLDSDISGTFNPQENEAFSRDGKAKRWMLYDASLKAIGRIAAFYNIMPNGKEKECGAGFFECIDKQEAANTLFDAAANWLKEEGFTQMTAPINFGDRDSFWGLMVEGFKNHAYRENFNYPYYQALFENYGFEKTIEQSTAEITKGSFNYERFSKIADRVKSNPRYEFRSVDWSNVEQVAEDFVHVYNKAWSHHDFFVPMTLEKIKVRMKLMKEIAPGDLNIFVYYDGEPVGFQIDVLDVNQIFKHVNGKLNLIGKLKFLWYRKKVNRVRAIVFGIVPGHHNKGLDLGLIMTYYENVRKWPKIKATELAWIGDFNPKMHSMFESMGAKRIKLHYTYAKSI